MARIQARAGVRVVLAVAVATFAAVPQLAGGQAVAPERDALMREGVELRRQRRDAEALDRFSRVHAVAPSGNTLGQMALAEQALGRWVDADRHVRDALATDDAWVVRNRGALEAARDEIARHLGRIEILGGPLGAQVLVNSEPRGRIPIAGSLAVPAGTATVEVRRSRERAEVRRVQVDPGAVVRETFATPGDASTPRGDVEQARRSTRDATWAPVVPERGDQRSLVVPAVVLGVAGAGLIGGVAGVAVRETAAQSSQSNCSPAQFWNAEPTTAMTARSRCTDANSAEAPAVATMIVGFGIAAIGVAVATPLLAIQAGRRDVAPTRVATCAPNPLGVTCVFEF